VTIVLNSTETGNRMLERICDAMRTASEVSTAIARNRTDWARGYTGSGSSPSIDVETEVVRARRGSYYPRETYVAIATSYTRVVAEHPLEM